MSKRFDEGLYLALLHATIGRLYDRLPSTKWNRFIKRRLGGGDTPRWAPEVFQLCFVGLGILFIVLPAPPEPGVVWTLVAAVLGLRLFDLLVFSLHWVFIARDPVKSHRRSLAAFGVNVLEVPLLYTALNLAAGCGSAAEGSWGALYGNASALLSMQLPTTHGETLGCKALAHSALLLEGIILLLALTVVVGMISRDEMNRSADDNPAI